MPHALGQPPDEVVPAPYSPRSTSLEPPTTPSGESAPVFLGFPFSCYNPPSQEARGIPQPPGRGRPGSIQPPIYLFGAPDDPVGGICACFPEFPVFLLQSPLSQVDPRCPPASLRPMPLAWQASRSLREKFPGSIPILFLAKALSPPRSPLEPQPLCALSVLCERNSEGPSGSDPINAPPTESRSIPQPR